MGEAASTPLLDRLRVDPVGADRFIGAAGTNAGHLFGGQLLAQGLLVGAASTDTELRAQSLHAVFLARGAGDRPVDYAVSPLRHGSSFATYNIIGSQDDQPIVALTASFHRPEGEVLHQSEPPGWVGSADGLPIGRYHSAEIESRDIPGDAAAAQGSDDPRQLGHWSRLRGPGPDDPATVAAVVAWMSDNGPTRAGRQPHLDHPGFDRIRTTSLDHHLWFHQPAVLDRWHVTVLRSVATTDARGLVRGTIHDDTGRHIASLTQEVLVRLPAS